MEKPLVSICCISYNQEKFIKATLDGFLMQKTDFPYEIVISDDFSNDNTRQIITEYKTKYPYLFRDVSPESNLGVSKNFIHVLRSARGNYIAFCEGDDYWTDPLKLQKQVDFMESHPECTVTFHRYNILQQEEQTWRKDRCDVYLKPEQEFVELTIPMYFANWVSQPCTMMYRRGIYMGIDKPYHGYKDQHMVFHLLNEGKGYILNFDGAVYRENRGGVHGRTSALNQSRLAVQVAYELYSLNEKTDALKENLIQTLDWAIRCEKESVDGDWKILWKYAWYRLKITKSLRKTIKRLVR